MTSEECESCYSEMAVSGEGLEVDELRRFKWKA